MKIRKLNKLNLSIFFFIIINILANFSSGVEYITLTDKVLLESYEKDMWVYSDNWRANQINVTWEFSQYQSYTPNPNVVTGNYRFYSESGNSLIIPDNIYLREAYLENVKTLQIYDSGSTIFSWYSDLEGVIAQTVKTDILFKSTTLNNVTIYNEYLSVSFTVIDNNIYENNIDTGIDITENQPIMVSFYHNYIDGKIQMLLYDYIDYDLKYIEEHTDTKLTPTISTYITNNNQTPVQIYGVGYFCDQSPSLSRSHLNDFENIQMVEFPYTIDYEQQDTDYNYSNTIDEYIPTPNHLINEYKGFLTFFDNSSFYGGNVNENLVFKESDVKRNNTSTIGIQNSSFVNVGESYVSILDSSIINNVTFDYWYWGDWFENNTLNQTFIGSGIKFDTCSLYIGIQYITVNISGTIYHQQWFSYMWGHNGTIVNIQPWDGDFVDNTDIEAYLSYNITPTSANFYINHTSVENITFDTNHQYIQRFYINGTNSYGNFSMDSIGIIDNDFDRVLLRPQYYETITNPNSTLSVDIIRGLYANYTVYRDSYIFGENEETYPVLTDYKYYKLTYNTTNLDYAPLYHISQRHYIELNITENYLELEIGVGLNESTVHLYRYYSTNSSIDNATSYLSNWVTTNYNSTEIFTFDIYVLLYNNTPILDGKLETDAYLRSVNDTQYPYGKRDLHLMDIDETVFQPVFELVGHELIQYEYKYYYLMEETVYLTIDVPIEDPIENIWLHIQNRTATNYTYHKKDVGGAYGDDEFTVRLDYPVDNDTGYYAFLIDIHQTNNNPLRVNVYAEYELVYFGTDRLFISGETPDTEEEIIPFMISSLIDILVYSGIFFILPIMMYNKMGINGLAIGFIISNIIIAIYSLFDITTIVISVLASIVLTYYISTKRVRDNFDIS